MTTVLLLHLLSTIGDPDGTRTVTSIVALLVALGLALAMVAVWLWRTTRPDPELLAPLEVMGERKWRRADPVAQRRTLDGVRPEGAEPLVPSAAPPMLDEAFEAGPRAPGFDDLHDQDGDDAAPGTTGHGDRRDDHDAHHDDQDDGDHDDQHDDQHGDRRGDGDHDERDRSGSPSVFPPPPVGEVTPRLIERPADFDDDIDPDLLAAAAAELDAELRSESGDG